MDGILNLNKPLGMTSRRALDVVRRVSGQRKSGYAGTLDPLAEGVLLICLGRGTKLVERLMDLPKVYRATVALDVISASHDLEQPTEAVPVDEPPALEQVRGALQAFEGTHAQLPPTTSALKIRGRPAYALHRSGREVVLRARPVTVYWTHLRSYAWPHVELDVACGRGTYIRSLARDLGAALRCGGCLTALARLQVGPFAISEAWELDRLRAQWAPEAVLDLARVEELMPAAAVPPRPASGGVF